MALVKRPAPGHRWHLLKSAPEPKLSGAEIDAALASLSEQEAQELVEGIDHQLAQHAWLDAIEAELAKAEATIDALQALGSPSRNRSRGPLMRCGWLKCWSAKRSANARSAC